MKFILTKILQSELKKMSSIFGPCTLVSILGRFFSGSRASSLFSFSDFQCLYWTCVSSRGTRYVLLPSVRFIVSLQLFVKLLSNGQMNINNMLTANGHLNAIGLEKYDFIRTLERYNRNVRGKYYVHVQMYKSKIVRGKIL